MTSMVPGFNGWLISGSSKIDWEKVKKFDKNGDNGIDMQEYNTLLKEVGVDGAGVYAFSAVDTDGNGLISQEELEAMIEKDQAAKDNLDGLINGVTPQQPVIARETENTPDDYSVDPAKLDYSSINGYKENATVTTKTGLFGTKNSQASNLIDSLKDQISNQIKANCEADGIAFDDALVNSIFSSAKQSALDTYVTKTKSFLGLSSKSKFKTKDLIDGFVSKFNTLMKAALEKTSKDDSESSDVPTTDSITTSYLNVDDSKLTNQQKAMKKLQKDLLVNGDKQLGYDKKLSGWFGLLKKPDKKTAKAILDTVSTEVQTQLQAKLDKSYDTNITTLIKDAETEILSKITAKTTKNELVASYMELIRTKYNEYKANENNIKFGGLIDLQPKTIKKAFAGN